MQVKKIVMASDHAACELKSYLKESLTLQGYEIVDYGTDSETQSVDYPDKAYLLAKSLKKEEADIGILLCGSGIGMSIAVNRYNHIRAALVHSIEYAKLARQHNNANVLVLGGRFLKPQEALEITNTFLTTDFEGDRHARRVAKLGDMPHDFE
ncbi:MAG: RpiB/LacA/LacB family sugar-phosphate isomerase [Alphaproteobacteria bacterium]|nr:RpiB/LacA/LacB family sugar-phosphate isomerase [Alphaproteobacteria bacterium]